MESSSCRERLIEHLLDKGYADFHKYRVEYILDLILVNESPLHVGSRSGNLLGEPVDLTVLKGTAYDASTGKLYEDPIIPGSSLKGVLRSLAESVAISRGLLFGEPLVLHMPNKNLKVLCTGEQLSQIESWLANAHCDDANEKTYSQYLEGCLASPIVGIFGAPWLGPHIEVGDAYPADMEPPRLRVVTRVSIDRLLGSQRPKQLYNIEIVEAGVRWKTRIRLYNIDLSDAGDERSRLVLLLLRMLSRGISVGGKTSVGQGRLRLLPEESTVTAIHLDPEEGFREERYTLSDFLRKQS